MTSTDEQKPGNIEKCLKAGLSPDAWKKEDVEVYIFTSEIISEKDVDS